MFPYASIHPEVASAATDLLRFDYYRLVDPRDHRVFAYDRDGDRLIEVDGPCYQLWNQDDPCLNCSSRACLTMQDAVFKIEYLDGRVLHVTSVPMDIEGAELVLELIKDVTDSLLVADIEVRDNIEITQMITKFNELAVRDGFTKLYNKTFINNELESLVQAARGGSPAGEAAVVLLDIDGFKQINDTYGHIAGDDALQYFASKMRSFSRSFDGWVGRFGGDEFVLCAPKGLSEGDLERLFAEIDAIERHAFQAEAGSFSLAASCGVCFVRPDDTVRSLLDRADGAMYRAKESGRRWVERYGVRSAVEVRG